MSEPINEREFELVNIIGAKLASNQRDLSRQMNMSLGMTNMLLRRLVTKGYIRITQLNKKKVQYILTPKGFSEKMKKSINYTLKTINLIGLINQKLTVILGELHSNGHRKFFVLGKSDLARLIENVLVEKFKNNFELRYIESFAGVDADGIVLICTEQAACPADSNGKCINLIEELAKDEALVG